MKATMLGVVAIAIFGSISCNTTVGLGRDMRVLGETVEKKAEPSVGGSGGSGGGGAYNAGGAPVY